MFLRYECIEGFEFPTKKTKTMTVTCLENGQWSEVESCEPIKCNPDEDFDGLFVKPLHESLKVSSRKELHCMDGFTVSPESENTTFFVNCETNGKSAPEIQFEKCVPSYCFSHWDELNDRNMSLGPIRTYKIGKQAWLHCDNASHITYNESIDMPIHVGVTCTVENLTAPFWETDIDLDQVECKANEEVCILTAEDLKIPNAKPYEEYPVGYWVGMEDHFYFSCEKDYYLAADRSKTNFSIFCYEDDKKIPTLSLEQANPNVVPNLFQCVSNVECPSDLFVNPSEHGFEGLKTSSVTYHFNDTVSLTCPGEYEMLKISTNKWVRTLDFQCQWNTSWTPYVNFTDLKCEDRSCQGAPRAPPSNGLEGPYLNGQFIPKHCYPRFKDGEQATYRCQEGYRLNTSHSQMSLALTCEPPHIQEAIWPHCISVTNCSKKHSGNATVYIHSRIVTEPLNYNFTPSVGDLGKPHLNLFWDTKWWEPVEEVVFYFKQIVPRTIFPNKTLKFCSKTCSMVDSDLSGWTYMIVFNCSQSASCFKTSFLVDEPTFQDSLSRIEIVRRKAVPSDYSDCAEFYRNGYAGLDRSILNSRRKWDRCEMGWTEILQRRLIEKQNFSTEDFQNVFINKSFFWKGLLNIKEMTNEKQQELKIEFFKSNGEKTQIRYDFFRIEEQGNYPFVLHIGQPDMLNSNVPDSFSVLNGTNFQSNFNLSNCGLNKTFHGWLNQCLITVDLFGEEFVWMGLDQSDELKAIKMAIRPQEFNESVMEDIQWILNNAPYNYGDQTQLFCRPGYELIDPGADSFTCDWEPNDPNYVSTCIAKSCPYLPHEKINLTNMIPILKGNTNEVLINKTISYHCKPGTFFEDNMTRTEMSFTCQPNMTYEYNRTQLTSCIWEKKCKNWPEKPLDGQIAVAKMPRELVGTCRGYLKPAIFPFCTSAHVTWHYVYSNHGEISMNISVSSSTNEPILLVFSHALNASNSSIAKFQNSSSQALLLDNFRFDPNSSDHLPCILNAFCGTNLSHFETLNEDSQTELGYHEAIRYSCNETQRFQRPNGSLEKWTFLRCDWTGQWLDSQGQLVENLDPCITVACPNPPAPPNETFLRLLNPTQSNQVVLINNSVTYKCQQGWKLGPDSQRDIYFNLTCLEDGNYSTDWPICENPNTKLCPPLEAGVPNGNYSVDNTSIPVQTEITFDCDWGFSVSANASFGNRTNATSQRFTCFWNQTWDTTILHPCERTHCTAPPNITYFHLSPVNLTSAVSVGDTVMYKCDSNNRFFENDKFQRHLGLTCQLDGLFYPLELTRCLLESEVICTDPPPLPPTGINRFWDENDNYFNSTAKYVCQTHRESISESVVESVCQWNKTWTQKIGSLNCSYTHCPRLPNPPLESGIFYSKEKSLANELDFVYDYRFGQPSPHEDYVLPIPPKFKDRVLVIDGYVSREETNQSTQLILMNYINKDYNEIYSIDLEPWLFGGASEEYFLLQIVQRNSSALNITNMETGIHRLQYNPEFNGLRLNGTVTINFIGFVLPGEAYAIPVGDTIAFVCPLDQVLTSKPYLEATLTLVCGTNGEFDVPNPWPKCVSFEEAMNTTKVEIDFHPPMKCKF